MIRPALLLLLLLLLPSVASWADYLGCYEPSGTVSGATAQFPGTATSVTANVMDPNDTTTPTAEPTMSAVGSGATNLWRAADFSVGGSPLAGTWTIQYEGTVNGSTVWGSDMFEVRALCPLKPTTAGRTLDVTATGEAGMDLDNTIGTLAPAEVPNLDAAITTRQPIMVVP